MSTEDRLVGYPLRQSLLPGAEGLQIFAVRGVVDWLSRPDRYLVICEGRGGRIYAADESFLHEARQVIREAHGDLVIMRSPEVHIYTDNVLQASVEPVMFLRIKTSYAYAPAILAELDRRELRILEKDMQRYDLVIRAEGRLVNTLGLTLEISLLARGSATIWTWLDRYEVAATMPSSTGQQSDDRYGVTSPLSADGALEQEH
ncbi:MAG: hypothetical protein EON54_07285 [Alcaligenaceae bacterium]|nr:MAG: hypothetical protein EON54_07285 [Alcaligenaceae bacterium]